MHLVSCRERFSEVVLRDTRWRLNHEHKARPARTKSPFPPYAGCCSASEPSRKTVDDAGEMLWFNHEVHIQLEVSKMDSRPGAENGRLKAAHWPQQSRRNL